MKQSSSQVFASYPISSMFSDVRFVSIELFLTSLVELSNNCNEAIKIFSF